MTPAATRIAARRLAARWTPSVAGLAALFAVAWLWSAGAHGAYDALLYLWGMIPFRFPFVDVNGSLAAWDCARRGVDIIVSDPCDVLKRPYNYSPFWMSLDWLPLGQADRVAVGLTLDIGFLLSLAALPPARSEAEIVVRTACVLSTMIVFALERANPDLLIFLLAGAALFCLRGTLAPRLLGYGVIFLAGAIKYYPFVLLSLMARERMRIFLPVVFAAIIGLLLFYHIYKNQILEGLPSIASGSPYGDMFGAKNFFNGVFHAAKLATGSRPAGLAAAASATAVLVVALILASLRLWRRSDIPGAIYRLDECRRLTLLAGVLLLSGCFFSGQNVGYRGIYLLLLLPGLFGLGGDEAAGSLARAAKWAAFGIPVLMWAEGIRMWIHLAVTGHFGVPWYNPRPIDLVVWLAREIAWWALISLCLTMAAGFFLGLPAAGLVFEKFSQRRGLQT